MFVVSVNDAGQERTILATDVFLNACTITIQAGGACHEFNRDDLLDVVPAGNYLAGPPSPEGTLLRDTPRFSTIALPHAP